MKFFELIFANEHDKQIQIAGMFSLFLGGGLSGVTQV